MYYNFFFMIIILHLFGKNTTKLQWQNCNQIEKTGSNVVVVAVFISEKVAKKFNQCHNNNNITTEKKNSKHGKGIGISNEREK